MKTLLLLLLALLFVSCDKVTSKHTAVVPKDSVAPKLTLLGEKNITLALHSDYKEFGAKAIDDYDGDISDKITTIGRVDSDHVGNYTIQYQVSDKADNNATTTREVRVTTFANARLGALGGATVRIYRFESDSNKTLIWQEKSSENFKLEKIGLFDTHADKLNSNALYLIELSGGEDFDKNNNGIKDSNNSQNSGILRAIVTRDDLTNLAQNLNITALSEIIYEEALPILKKNYSKEALLSTRDSIATSFLKDINGDGVVDYSDILLFNPARDQSKLLGELHNNYNRYADIIRDGKIPILNSSAKVANIPTYGFARDITQNSDGTKLYIADGKSGITIIDKATNRVISNIKTKDFARHITLSTDESLAYVADSKAGLTVVDIANKQIVANIPTYDLNSTGDHDARYILMAQDESKLYLAASKSGVLSFDISNPRAPRLVGAYDSQDIAYNMKLSNDEKVLFIADGKTGLIAIDTESNSTLGIFNTYGNANGVTLSKDESKAYIADGYKGLVIVNISDPTNINYLEHIDTPDFATAVKLNKNETKAYIADRKSNIQIVNLESDTHSIIKSLSTPYRTYAIMLTESEDSLYAATGSNGVELITLHTLPNPLIVNTIASDYKAYRVLLKDNTEYTAQGKAGLQIVDIKDIYNPQIKSTFDTNGFTMDIAIDGNTTYLADGYKGVKKLDTSDPENPVLIDDFDTNGFTSSLQLVPNSNLLIISDGTRGIKLFDKYTLTLLDTLLPSEKPLDITVTKDGKTAYAALGKGGVMVIEIETDSLKQKSIIETENYIKHITLDNDRAYLSGADSKLLILNLANSSITKSISVGDFAYSATVDSGYIYVANAKDGLIMLDKKGDHQLGKINCQGAVRDIAIKDGALFVASSERGVAIIDTTLLHQ